MNTQRTGLLRLTLAATLSTACTVGGAIIGNSPDAAPADVGTDVVDASAPVDVPVDIPVAPVDVPVDVSIDIPVDVPVDIGDDVPADIGVDIPCATGQLMCGGVCIDVQSDVANCGGCGVTCSLPNSSAVCTAGACAVGTCTAGYANTDGNAANGCEVNIDDCTPNPCQNSGTCTDGVNSFTCACTGTYTGARCETFVCPTGSTSFMGHCYQSFTTLPASTGSPFNYWTYADNDCATRFTGGHLVSIGSLAENVFVRTLVPITSGIMIGFSDFGRGSINNFGWLDGSTGTYTNWALHEPSNNSVNRFGTFLTEDWASMNPDGTWNDLPYTDGNPYVCKF